MKIRLKLIVSFIFLIVLTVVLYGMAGYSTMSRPLFEMERSRGFHYTGLIAFKFNELLNHAANNVSLMTRKDFFSYIQNPEKTILPQKEQTGIVRNEFIQNVILQEDSAQHRLNDSLEEGSLLPSEKDLEIRILPLSGPNRPLLRIYKKFYTSKGSLEGEGFIFLDLKKIFDNLIFKDSQITMCVCIRDLSGRLLYCRYNDPLEEEKEHKILTHIEKIARSPEETRYGLFDVSEISTEDGRPSIFHPLESPTFSSVIPVLGLPMFIEADSQSFQSLVSSMAQNMIIIGISVIWLAFWMAMIIGYRIMKPIEQLGSGAERITSGEYHHRLRPKGKDEIALLAGKFNHMAEAVEKRTRELEHSNEELREQDTTKTRFLDTVAHDLRTPLTSIKAYADLLTRFPDEKEETKQEFLDIIMSESDRMGSLINDYLDLTKIESGILPYRFQKVDITAMVLEFEQINKGECRLKNITIRSKILGELPPIWADPDRLRQVFSNLLSNAIKYSPSGGEVAIEAACIKDSNTETGSDWIEISVSDQGPGIPEEFHEMIFDKFRQVEDSALASNAGTGLGLPISREIISRHSGKIWLEKSNGSGSLFKFRILVKPLEGSTI
jgi:signal transduction histidine kinase